MTLLTRTAAPALAKISNYAANSSTGTRNNGNLAISLKIIRYGINLSSP